VGVVQGLRKLTEIHGVIPAEAGTYKHLLFRKGRCRPRFTYKSEFMGPGVRRDDELGPG